MARRINVILPEPVAEKLAELALRDLRGTREQAAYLLTEAVERASRPDRRRRPVETVR
jgi:hypothetical protein